MFSSSLDSNIIFGRNLLCRLLRNIKSNEIVNMTSVVILTTSDDFSVLKDLEREGESDICLLI